MRHPFRYYCYSLAERLNLSLKELYSKLDAAEIAEWMAYDLTKDEEFSKKLKYENELKATEGMSGTDLAALFRGMGGKHIYGNDS